MAAGPDRAIGETAQRDGHSGEGMGDLREQDGHVPHPRDVPVPVTGRRCSLRPLGAAPSSASASSGHTPPTETSRRVGAQECSLHPLTQEVVGLTHPLRLLK
eukprot:COSAG02_NODE_474_length_21578_cov_225.787746_1_plen_102_part_00